MKDLTMDTLIYIQPESNSSELSEIISQKSNYETIIKHLKKDSPLIKRLRKIVNGIYSLEKKNVQEIILSEYKFFIEQNKDYKFLLTSIKEIILNSSESEPAECRLNSVMTNKNNTQLGYFQDNSEVHINKKEGYFEIKFYNQLNKGKILFSDKKGIIDMIKSIKNQEKYKKIIYSGGLENIYQ